MLVSVSTELYFFLKSSSSLFWSSLHVSSKTRCSFLKLSIVLLISCESYRCVRSTLALQSVRLYSSYLILGNYLRISSIWFSKYLLVSPTQLFMLFFSSATYVHTWQNSLARLSDEIFADLTSSAILTALVSKSLTSNCKLTTLLSYAIIEPSISFLSFRIYSLITSISFNLVSMVYIIFSQSAFCLPSLVHSSSTLEILSSFADSQS